jgi:hypothetical protein
MVEKEPNGKNLEDKQFKDIAITQDCSISLGL